MAKRWGPVTLANEIRRIRVVFRYAEQNQLVAAPIRYGSEFKPPPRRVLRKERQGKGLRMFEAEQVRAILDKAETPLKAMVLLAINTGLGNYDITCLPSKAINLKTAWLDYPRQKTSIGRRCPLWPETVAAIRESLKHRPKPKKREHAGLLFVTKYGQPWGVRSVTEPDKKGKVRKNADDPVCKEFAKLIKALKLHRHGLGFYALRHTFETIGGDSGTKLPSTPSWATHATIWPVCTASALTTTGCWPLRITSESGFSEIKKRSRITHCRDGRPYSGQATGRVLVGNLIAYDARLDGPAKGLGNHATKTLNCCGFF